MVVLTVSSCLVPFGPSSPIGYGGNATVSADQTRVTPTIAFPGAGAAFTDDPLVEGATVVRAVHVAVLRPRINGARLRFGLSCTHLPIRTWRAQLLRHNTSSN